MTEEPRSLRAARFYTGHGISVIPVPAREKGPTTPGWQNLRLGLADLPRTFHNGSNIGILTGEASGGLVDIDLDAPEALAAADFFLPATTWVSGRPGKPASHRWYRCAPLVDSDEFEDPNRESTQQMLLEFRANKRQTIAPPSVHPDGEEVGWASCVGEPPELPGPVLLGYVRRIAAAALLARYWPSKGSRHHCALALVGALCRRTNWDDDTIKQFVLAVIEVAGDNESRDRLETVASTRARLARGEAATGVPRLMEYVGERVIWRISEWLEWSQPTAAAVVMVAAAITQPWPDPLNEAAFYGITGQIVRLIEPETEADPAALLLNFLVAAGNCIGRGPHALVGATRHGVNLFAVLVGATSKGRKGTSWDPIRALFERVDQTWVTNRVKSGLSSGEGLIHEIRDPVIRDVEIREKGHPTGDWREEIVDPGVTDKRLLLVESEYAMVLKVMSRDGNTLSDQIRKAWDIGELGSLTRASPLRASRTHISILGHIGQTELLKYLTDTEGANGFANRYLWGCVQRARELPEGGNLPDLGVVAGELVRRVQLARAIGQVVRDDEAREGWAQIYGDLSAGKPGMFGAVTSRGEAQVLRLSVLYAVLDGSPVITLEHLRAALAVWEYCEASARYIFGDALGDATADRIQEALRQAPEGLTRTQVHDLFGRNARGPAIQRALDLLVRLGRARVERRETAGRPQETWYAA